MESFIARQPVFDVHRRVYGYEPFFRKEDSFLMGLFPLIDAFLDRPLSAILEEIPIDEPIKLALLGEPKRLRDIYQYTLSYEKAAWGRLEKPIIPRAKKQPPSPSILRP